MAEKETKEKASLSMNIWFIILVVYFGISFLFFMNQNKTIATLNEQVANLQTQLNDAVTDSNTRSENLIKDLEKVIENYRNSTLENNTTKTPVLNGTYTGTAVVTEDKMPSLSMTLTLSDNKVASVTRSDLSGDTLVNGTYNVVDNSVNFTSEDGLTTYTFTVVNDSTLKLVDATLDLTLVK